MRRLSLLAVIGLFIFTLSNLVYADQAWPIKSKMFTANSRTANDSDLDAGTMIYGIKVVASAGTNAWVAIYDSTTLDEDNADIIDEASCATQFNDSFNPLPEPIKVIEGSSIITVNGIGIVYYRD